jgi:phosphatidylglycerol---prolipoprotein diacylglyceryl transferase
VLAVIELNFDPFLRIGDLAIRWQTIEVTFALLAAFALAALMAPPRAFYRDRLVLIIAAAVPGAVVVGRLVHMLVYWEAYAAAPLSIFDPSVGSLSLFGAVFGGVVTASFIARLLEVRLALWADVAAVPFLLALGFGKLAQLLGGSGQGIPFDGPWAVAFLGEGPWISANPALPSHPSQVYEGVWYLIGIPVVVGWVAARRRGRRASGRVVRTHSDDGSLFVAALSWFLVGRVLVGFTWRDDALIGPLNAEQLLAFLALVGIHVYGWWATDEDARSIVPTSERGAYR